MSSNTTSASIRRGELYLLDWSPGRGSEQTGRRPALIVQRDAANRNPRYPNTVVLTVTTHGKVVPFHVEIQPSTENGLTAVSFIKCEQLLTVSKERLEQYIGRLSAEEMNVVDAALRDVLDLE